MAGAGYKLFNTGDVLTAAQVNTYLNEQTVMVFASSAARTSALSGVLAEGMVSYLQDTNAVEVYNGSAWVGVSGAGDLTEIVAGTGITVTSGTGPIPTVALTTPVAATNGGTAQTTYTTGDLLYASGTNTLAKRAIGSTGNVLTVSGGIPTWAAPAAGGGYTLLNSGGTALSGSPINITSISGSYTDLYLVLQDWQISGNAWSVRFNNDSSTDYYQTGTTVNGSGSGALKGNAQADKLDSGISPSSGNQLNTTIIWVRNYADSTCAKVGTIQHFAKASTNREMSFVGIGYYNTTAITEINLIVDSPQTFNGGTYFLYGVK